MIRIGIVDDELNALDVLQEFVSAVPGYEVKVISTDPQEMLKACQTKKIDVLISDIRMPGLDGVVLSELSYREKIPVIICSAYPKRAVECIHTQVVGFIQKPIRRLFVFFALEKAKERLELLFPHKIDRESPYIMVSKFGNKSMQKIMLDDIVYVEQKGNYSIIHTWQDIVTYRITFSRLLDSLPEENFWKIHKSYAFNYLYFSKLDHKLIHLTNGDIIPIGRTFEEQVYKRINDHFID
ncbi:LytTR family DNA-binding domain-containing protein [Algoriphagus sp. NG3]|uniref:LytR/AlgR family response regulator transcription factor n=1 Tax=Algoriphagus sp. NG3 TaxID=3097546 RepID=UPI002A7F6AE9|nr:LytTR family DNA-binding domain-containing protein [Algoriphagus sp. NG3]WPR77494.1 LytTR family DNA-binding domain-containing protein [Algoriphagus sp. NG3]